MLHMPSGSKADINIIGIDPGSDKLGVCVLNFDVITKEINSTYAFTIVGSRLDYNQIDEIQGERFARLAAMGKILLNVFYEYSPFDISAEAPFMNSKFPGAYAPLVETRSMIKDAIIAYNPLLTLNLVDPSSVKNAVGAKGNVHKDPVKEAVMKMDFLKFKVSPSALDEHSIDGTAVAYWRYKTLLGM